MEDARRNSIKTLTRIFYDYQRERIGLDGRLGLTKNGNVKKKAPEKDMTILTTLVARRDDVYAQEIATGKELAKEIHQHSLWQAFLQNVKGCGETIAAVIISEFDIEKWEKVSNGWSFAGLAPGKDRKTKGHKCPYNQFLRAKLCGVLGTSFLQSSSPYREYYDNMKHRLESQDWGMESKNPTNKERPKAGHQHKAATRYMIKMFLRDVYVAWRTVAGLKVWPPYQEAYLGHKHGDAA